ncbi:hypothetical protein CQ14_06715 [Bradyrhizobium lablabi]|uniref:Uncharacterized protein n=1 Tax=Bradyrhizobium lablabi TaxID=722472 RepID=A0A0R3MM13_9BRAD|nr:hypothetical protein [Bradyrhizobium lablabi]KRR21336.1 hypothetical protein CQ14_06715 [Bradyrhizobium lablabi]
MKPSVTETLAQIKAAHFVAGIVLHDDVVVETAPIVRQMRRWSRDKAREYCRKCGWDIRVVSQTQVEPKPSAVTPGIVQHAESFEVMHADGRIEFVYYDENPGSRAVNGRLSKQAAFVRAQEILRGGNPERNPKPLSSRHAAAATRAYPHLDCCKRNTAVR